MKKLKPIERPLDWAELVSVISDNTTAFSDRVENALDSWFNENVAPLNILIEGAIDVYYDSDEQDQYFWHEHKYPESEKRAYLIGIEEIKKESAEDLLRDLERIIHRSKYTKDNVDHYDCGFNNSNPKEVWELCQRARAILDRGES